MNTSDWTHLVVVGAHLRGQPLNRELTELGAQFVRACQTGLHYALYALRGGGIAKPGLVRVVKGGQAFEVEQWRLPTHRLGAFMRKVKAPLCMGTVELDDGSTCLGFLCEAYATAEADDISSYAGWRDYIERGGGR